MSQELVRIELIGANPFQPRGQETEEHIANLAVSIADDGLMQIPSARKLIDDYYQVAFGHSRLAAFRLLNDLQSKLENHIPIAFDDDTPLARAVRAADIALENGTRFNEMPLNIMDMDDETMFRFAVSENVQRKDLNAIETARAMRRYRDDFKRSSKDVGTLFGVNDATVRGTLRLLDLDQDFQERVANGEMTVGAARKVLAIQRVLTPEDIQGIKKDMKSSGRSMDELIEAKVEGSTKLLRMWSRWSSGEPRGGDGLWPLSWTYKTPPYSMPQTKNVKKLWTGPEQIGSYTAEYVLGEIIMAVISIQPGRRSDNPWVELPALHPEWKEAIEFIHQLASPPPCTACPFYFKQDGSHYCGFKVCHQNKLERWVIADMQKRSKELGISIYDRDRDGRDFIRVDNSYDKTCKAWWEAKHPGLRLMFKSGQYNHGFTNSCHIAVIMVGAEAEKAVAEEKAAKVAEAEKDQRDSWQSRQKRRDIHYGAVKRFVWDHAAQIFGTALKDLPGGVLDILSGEYDTGYSKPQGYGEASQVACIANGMIYGHRERYIDRPLGDKSFTPVADAAKYLRGLATTWGVKLPADWLTIATSYEPDLSEFADPVSTETEAQNG